MTTNDYLYKEDYSKIKIFRVSDRSGVFNDWKLKPIVSQVLSFGQEIDINDFLIVKAFFIKSKEKISECYTDVSLPERISESVYLWDKNQLVEKRRWEVEGDIIPQVAINHFGDYELFYSRRNPELGIEILENGLNLVEKKFAIALDLAYILRDEGKNEAAIEAFSIAIGEEGSANYYSFIERAQLLEKIGNHQKADEDWKVVKNLAGTEVLKMYRGNNEN